MIDRRAETGGRTGRLLRTVTGGPLVTHALIAACALVFVVSPLSGFHPVPGGADALLAAQAGYFERWGVIPSELWDGSAHALLTPFTALFVHGSWLHLLGNVLFLYVFGAMTEERMGRVGFTFFYVISGYLALVAYAAAHATSDQTLVGASGAISAVLGAFLYLFPGPGSPACSRSSSSCRCASPPGSCWSSGSCCSGWRSRARAAGAGGRLSGPCGGLRPGLSLRLGALPACG